MPDRLDISPVPRRKRDAVLEFVSGGSRSDEIGQAKFHALRKLAAGYPDADVTCWRARRGRRTVAAVAVLVGSGRTAMAFVSAPQLPGVDADALAETVGTAGRAVLAEGVSLVQAILLPEDEPTAKALRGGGFVKLAELIYLARSLDEPLEPHRAEAELEWVDGRRFTDEQLAGVISSTYEQSLDCPALSGVRRMEDILAGHRAVGQVRPEAWWIIRQGGVPAGCILVNDYPTTGSCEVVYMGVASPMRGKGYGAAMLRRSARSARQRGLHTMTLAVDADNVPARKVYEREGFASRDRRVTYALIGGRNPR